MSIILLLQERGLLSNEVVSQINQLTTDGQTIEEALLKSGIEPAVLKAVSSEYYQVPLFEIIEGFEINADALNGKPGIWSHTSVRKDKSDVHPQDELIAMLKTL